jgi:hypothetical protein
MAVKAEDQTSDSADDCAEWDTPLEEFDIDPNFDYDSI